MYIYHHTLGNLSGGPHGSHRCGVAVAELGPGGDGESEGGRARARISESGICVIPC